MRISKLNIDKYGPLEDIKLKPSSGFQLYFGRNESGKTLLVDAMIKMMIGDNNSKFPQLARVDQSPAGSLIMETDDGDEIVLPSDGFSAITDNIDFDEFSVKDLRNTFIIRDVDLRRPNKGDFKQSDYFRRLTDSLIGVETQRIEEIRKELKDIGFLTNATSDSRLRNKQEEDHLKDKKEAAESLLSAIKEYRDECERQDVVQKFSKKKELEQNIKNVEERLEILEKAKDKKKLEDGRKLVEQLKEKQDEIKDHTEKEKENEEYRQVQSDVEEMMKGRKAERLSPEHHKKGFIASSVLFIASVIGAIFASILFMGFSIAFGIPLGYFGWKLFGWYRLDKESSDIIERANRLGVEGSTLSEISVGVEQYLGEFEKRKTNLQESKGEIIGNLKGIFEGQGETLDYWDEMVEDFAEEVDEDVEVKYDQSREEELEDYREKWNKELKKINKSLKEHSEKIWDFDKEISNIPLGRFLDVDEVDIRGIEDLTAAKKFLKKFTKEIENRVEYSRRTIALLEDLESEEEREISKLLNGDGYALSFFKDVTDGNYIDLGYDEEEGVVKVTRVDGKELTPDELSQGTYDLLYMAIRIGLARKLMGDESGFQILDNPFLQSDRDRIRREMKILKQLAEDGWNILYFSFRDSVKETIKDIFGSSFIKELPPLQFRQS